MAISTNNGTYETILVCKATIRHEASAIVDLTYVEDPARTIQTLFAECAMRVVYVALLLCFVAVVNSRHLR